MSAMALHARCRGAPSTSGQALLMLPSAGTLHGARHATAGWRSWGRPARAPRQRAVWRAASSTAAADPSPAPVAGTDVEEGDWIEVGYITMPHGVYGEMKVQPLTDEPEERLGQPGTRWLQAPRLKLQRRAASEPPRRVELEGGRSMISKGQEIWLVKLEGVDSPEDAALLRGHTLLIPPMLRAPLEDEDEFYVQDLVGLRVYLQASGEELGRVVDLFDGTGTHDVLRIQLLQGPEEAAAVEGPRHVLLPFAKAMVPVVDVQAGRMEVTPPEGLLDLATTPAAAVPRPESRGQRQRRRPRPRRGEPSNGGAGGSVAGS